MATHYIPRAVSKTNFNVRLSDTQLASLKRIAEANAVEVSQLIRWAIDALIRHVGRNGGRIVLPVDFAESYIIEIREPHSQAPSPSLRVAEEPPHQNA